MLERLLKALDDRGYKKHGRATKIAKSTGYSVTQVSDMLSGKNPLSEKFLRLVCSENQISIDWVKTGEGEELLDGKKQPSLVETAAEIGLQDEMLLTLLSKLPLKKKNQYILEILKDLPPLKEGD